MPLLKVNQIASYSGNTLTVGTTGDTVTLAAGASSSGFGATYNSGLNWTSTLVTSALTLTAGTGYFVNTSTAAITVTLPASPTFGSIIGIADYSGYAATNKISINPNGNKLEGGTSLKLITTNKESVFLTYTDTTRGWLPTSGVNNGSDALSPNTYSIDFLIVAGGGGGSSGAVSGGGGAGGYRTSTQTANVGETITVTVGTGGSIGGIGNNSSISGAGLTTITSAGGGDGNLNAGTAGGSGGGAGRSHPSGTGGGAGNTPSTSPSQGNNGGATYISGGATNAGGGGGGAGAVGANGSSGGAGNGGVGVANSITGSSVFYAGGGGAGAEVVSVGSGGNGGGGAGSTGGTATAGTANTGGGGGGAGYSGGGGTGAAGGSGVVILSVPTSSYSGTSTGSPTITTSGSNTILKFTGSGSYTV